MSEIGQRRRGSGQDHRDGAEEPIEHSASAPPRQTIAIAPLVVSDRTCDAVIGVPWRALRAWCAARKIPVVKIGRRPCVRVDSLLAVMERASGQCATTPEWSPESTIALACGGKRGSR